MLIGQATRNPFEIERIRLQRRIDRFRNHDFEADAKQLESFEMVKEGLRRLLASGARDVKEARELVKRIRRIASEGTPIEISTIKVWPKGEDVRPTYQWFVNERIDLLVREAETFRNDYRNKEPKHVFLSLEKPIPFYGKTDFSRQAPDKRGRSGVTQPGQIETMKYCGSILLSVSLGCCLLASWVIRQQNRSVS
jgi:hypothetical protein